MDHSFLKRFDLIMKYIYVKYNTENINTIFYINYYMSLINAFNGGYEQKNLQDESYIEKLTIEDFVSSFNSLIKNIKQNGFCNEHPIMIGNNDVIINGSHRMAICKFFNITPMFKKYEIDGTLEYNFSFFVNRSMDPQFKNLDNNVADFMALEYTKQNKNMFTVIQFPMSKSENIDKVIELFEKYECYLYYKKTINYTKLGLQNLINELYRGEKWVGGLFPSYETDEKLKCCYLDDYPTIVYFINVDDSSKLLEMKSELRDLFNIGKHSIHINDYHNESVRIASSVLSNNTVEFFNNNKITISQDARLLLEEYFDLFGDKNRNDYCIDGSIIMDMCGLRKCSDLDYISHNFKKIETSNNKISMRNNHYCSYYNNHIDDIIFNPQNHFYFNGFKFTTLNILHAMKTNRNETKDIIDCIKISKYIKNVINICFACSWAPVENINESYSLYTPENNGIWNKLKLSSLSESGYVVILSDKTEDFIKEANKTNKIVIYIQREETMIEKIPNELIKKYDVKHLLTHNNMFQCSTYSHFIGLTYDDLKGLKYPNKQKKISCVVSKKIMSDEHEKRVKFVEQLAEKFPGMIDIYGIGWSHTELNGNYKGDLGNYNKCTNTTKKDGLLDYKYSIVLENTIEENCFTEKFNDAVLCWCVPVYYGCPEIDTYFPENTVVKININKFEETCNIINKIINDEIIYNNDIIKNIEISRNLILDKYNILNTLNCFIDNEHDVKKTKNKLIYKK